MKFCLIIGVAASVLGATGAAATTTPVGREPSGPATCGIPFSITEHASVDLIATFEVVATDCNGKIIPGFHIIKSGQHAVGFDIPGTVNGIKVGDAGNRTLSNVHPPKKKLAGTLGTESDPGSAESFLNIESLYHDPVTGLWQFEGANGLIQAEFGGGVVVPIPDIYADTNGNGVIGTGDRLYSWVDLRVFIQTVQTFDLGDTYTIVDGRIAELPGMWFSSTEIFLDPVLGPQPTGGSWYNSGAGAFAGGEAPGAYSEHDVSTIPEPQTWWLLVSGFGLAAIGLRRTARPSSREPMSLQ